jgi:hypothetical protein
VKTTSRVVPLSSFSIALRISSGSFGGRKMPRLLARRKELYASLKAPKNSPRLSNLDGSIMC